MMDINSDTKLCRICRICLEEIPSSSELYDVNYIQNKSELTVGQKLNYCVPEVDLNITQQTLICSDCFTNINSMHKFKTKCMKTEKQIRQVQNTSKLVDLEKVTRFYNLQNKVLDVEIKEEPLEIKEVIEPNYRSSLQDVQFKANDNYIETITESKFENNNDVRFIRPTEEVNIQDVYCNTDENYTNYLRKEAAMDSEINMLSSNSLNRQLENYNKESKKQFKCVRCNIAFASKCSAYAHMKSHIGQKRYECLYCKYQCFEQKQIQSHLQIHSEDKKTFKCLMCNFKCTHEGILQCHMKTHVVEKLFKCPQCDYQCKKKITLQIHMRIHTGEKLFKCSHCMYRSNRKSNLQSHIMRIHFVEQQPFKCLLCGDEFKTNLNLKTHMRVHSENKPFDSDPLLSHVKIYICK